MDMQETKRTTVNIPSEYYHEIQHIVDESTKFDSVENFIDFVLHEVLFDADISAAEDEIKQRLSDLGYL